MDCFSLTLRSIPCYSANECTVALEEMKSFFAFLLVVFELCVIEVSEALVCGLLQLICIKLEGSLHMIQL